MDQVETLSEELTPELIQGSVTELLEDGEDPGGGVNAFRLVAHLLDEDGLSDTKLVQAYDRLKPALRQALTAIPSLYYFEGD